MSLTPPIFPPLRERELRFSVRQVGSRWDLRRASRLPRALHRGDPRWAPDCTEDLAYLADGRRNPTLEGAKVSVFVAEGGSGIAVEQMQGTVATWGNAAVPASALFGAFETVNEPAVAGALLGRAEEWAFEHIPGVAQITGPASLHPLSPPGILVDGFDRAPLPGMPYDPPYYPDLIEAEGFGAAFDLLAFQVDLTALPDKLQDSRSLYLGVSPERHLLVKTLRPEDRSLPGRLAGLAVASGFGLSTEKRPCDVRTASFVVTMLRKLKPVSVVLVEDEAGLLGVGAVIRGRASWHTRLLGQKERHVRSARAVVVGENIGAGDANPSLVGALLVHAIRAGFRLAEVSPLHVADEVTCEALRRIGGQPVKRYRVYRKDL